MKRNYTIYRPSKLIRDMAELSDNYYLSKDIKLSPFTKIGSLIGTQAPQAFHEPQFHGHPAAMPNHTPVFPRNFKFTGMVGSHSRRSIARPNLLAEVQMLLQTLLRHLTSTLHTVNGLLKPIGATTANFIKSGAQGALGVLGASLGAVIIRSDRVWRGVTHAHVLPKKYIINKGLRTHFSGKSVAIAKLSAITAGVLVAVIMLAGIRSLFFSAPHGPNTSTPGSSSSSVITEHPISSSVFSTPTTPKPARAANATQSQNNPQPASASNEPAASSNTSTQALNGSPTVPQGQTATGSYPTYDIFSPSLSPTSSSSATSITQPSSPAVPGVTTPYTIPLSGQSIQSNNKPIAGTSPTTITLN